MLYFRSLWTFSQLHRLEVYVYFSRIAHQFIQVRPWLKLFCIRRSACFRCFFCFFFLILCWYGVCETFVRQWEKSGDEKEAFKTLINVVASFSTTFNGKWCEMKGTNRLKSYHKCKALYSRCKYIVFSFRTLNQPEINERSQPKNYRICLSVSFQCVYANAERFEIVCVHVNVLKIFETLVIFLEIASDVIFCSAFSTTLKLSRPITSYA